MFFKYFYKLSVVVGIGNLEDRYGFSFCGVYSIITDKENNNVIYVLWWSMEERVICINLVKRIFVWVYRIYFEEVILNFVLKNEWFFFKFGRGFWLLLFIEIIISIYLVVWNNRFLFLCGLV